MPESISNVFPRIIASIRTRKRIVALIADGLPPLMMQNSSIRNAERIPERGREKPFRRSRNMPIPIREICRPETASI